MGQWMGQWEKTKDGIVEQTMDGTMEKTNDGTVEKTMDGMIVTDETDETIDKAT